MSAFTEAELSYLSGGRQLGRIATVGADGTPHVVPVGWIYNAARDAIEIGGIELEPQASTVAPAEAIEQLTEALERARRLLGRLSGARRAELVGGLQQLTETVAATVQALSDESSPAAAETE